MTPTVMPDAHAMAVAIEPVIPSPDDEDAASNQADGSRVDHRPHGHHRGRRNQDGQCVASRHGQQRQLHGPAAVPMQSESHGEQPTHGRIETVEHAETRKGEPGPRGFQRHFSFMTVAAAGSRSQG